MAERRDLGDPAALQTNEKQGNPRTRALELPGFSRLNPTYRSL